MIVKQILANNFVTYESLNVQFPERGIIGIEGKNLDKPVLDTNAVGKTIILDMISYALYGEILRKKAANIIGPFSPDMMLSVKFYLPKINKEFTIKRERRGPNEVVKIKMDGKISEGRPRKMQPVIDRLLGIEWLTFTNCILYGDSRDSNFVYVGHSKRIEILAQIAGILHLREARKILNPDLKEAEKILAHTDGKIEALKEQRAKAKKNLEYHEAKLDNLDNENKEFQREISKKLSEIVPAHDAIDVTNGDKRISEIDGAIKDMEYRISQYENEALQIKKAKPDKRLQELTKQKVEIQTIIKTKKEELEYLESNGECPTCYGEVDEGTKKRFMEHMPELPSDIDNKINLAKKAIARINELNETINEVEKEVRKLRGEQVDIRQKILKKKNLKQEIDKLKLEMVSWKDLREEIQNNIDNCQIECDETSEKFSRVTFLRKSQKTNRDVLKYWSDKYGPKGAEADLIRDLLNKLQAFSNNYIHKLTDGSISIYMTPEKESASGVKRSEMSIDVIENAEIKDFDLYSGGQKNRIEKAIRLGLMMILPNDVGFKLFDEIGKDLSPKGYEEIIKLMREIFHEQQIFIVTNDNESKKLFDHLMMVTLKDGKSTLDCSWGNNDG